MGAYDVRRRCVRYEFQWIYALSYRPRWGWREMHLKSQLMRMKVWRERERDIECPACRCVCSDRLDKRHRTVSLWLKSEMKLKWKDMALDTHIWLDVTRSWSTAIGRHHFSQRRRRASMNSRRRRHTPHTLLRMVTDTDVFVGGGASIILTVRWCVCVLKLST